MHKPYLFIYLFIYLFYQPSATATITVRELRTYYSEYLTTVKLGPGSKWRKRATKLVLDWENKAEDLNGMACDPREEINDSQLMAMLQHVVSAIQPLQQYWSVLLYFLILSLL